MWSQSAVSEDERLDRAETLGVLRRAYSVAAAQRRLILVALGLVVLSTLITLAGPTLLRYAIDHGIKDRNGRTLNIVVIAYIVVVLAGYMRILSDEFVNALNDRLLNIHPSLLPAHKGLHTHRRAIEAHDTQHGATVHFVTAELDGGPRILRGVLTLHPSDDENSLQRRVQRIEHAIYPEALELLARGRLRQGETGAELDGQTLVEPLERQFDF